MLNSSKSPKRLFSKPDDAGALADLRSALLHGASVLGKRVRDNAASMPPEELEDMLDVLVAVERCLNPPAYERLLPQVEELIGAMIKAIGFQRSGPPA